MERDRHTDVCLSAHVPPSESLHRLSPLDFAHRRSSPMHLASLKHDAFKVQLASLLVRSPTRLSVPNALFPSQCTASIFLLPTVEKTDDPPPSHRCPPLLNRTLESTTPSRKPLTPSRSSSPSTRVSSVSVSSVRSQLADQIESIGDPSRRGISFFAWCCRNETIRYDTKGRKAGSGRRGGRKLCLFTTRGQRYVINIGTSDTSFL